MLDVPVWAAAIEGAGRKILVDTGIRDAAKWSRIEPHTVTPDETVDAALAELGWRSQDVDIVINTHLHYDHAENNLAFPRRSSSSPGPSGSGRQTPAAPRPGRTTSTGRTTR